MPVPRFTPVSTLDRRLSNIPLLGGGKARTMGTAPASELTAMGSPPTLTLTAAVEPAASTKKIAWNWPGYRSNMPMINNGSEQAVGQSPIYANETERAGPAGSSIRREFDFDGQYFSVRVSSQAGLKLRIWVNEIPSSSALILASTITGYTVGGQYLNVNFGSRAYRRLVFEYEDTANAAVWGSAWTDPRDSITPPSTPSPLVMWVGDSYGLGLEATYYSSAFSIQAARMLGWPNLWNQTSVASTGLVATHENYGNYKSRLAKDVLPYMPETNGLLVIQGSINDGPHANTVAQALAEYYAAFKAQRPKIPVVITSPLFAAEPTSEYLTIASILQERAETLGLPYLNMMEPETPTFTGTGKAGSPADNGNADYYRTSAGFHPNEQGHYYLAHQIATKLAIAAGQQL
jgi:lysophospholipase L1-like esterase